MGQEGEKVQDFFLKGCKWSKRDCGDGCPILWMHANVLVVHFKWANCMVHELHLSKALIPKYGKLEADSGCRWEWTYACCHRNEVSVVDNGPLRLRNIGWIPVIMLINGMVWESYSFSLSLGYLFWKKVVTIIPNLELHWKPQFVLNTKNHLISVMIVPWPLTVLWRGAGDHHQLPPRPVGPCPVRS